MVALQSDQSQNEHIRWLENVYKTFAKCAGKVLYYACSIRLLSLLIQAASHIGHVNLADLNIVHFGCKKAYET